MTALRKVIVGIIITIPIRTILMITVAAVVITRATVEEGMMKETISLVLEHDHPDDIIILAVDVVEGRVLRHPIIDVAEVPTQKVAAVEDMAAMVEAVVVLGVEAVVVVAAVVVVLVEILPLPALRKNTPTKKENSSCTPTWCRTRATSRCLRCCLTPYPPSMVSTAPQLPPAQCRLSCDVLCTYSVRWSHTNPQRTRDIAAHRRILLPPTVSLPRYQAPPLPCALKRKLPPQYMEYAENSVAQLLLASQRCGAPDACYFHVVTQRTCLKKMSMRDESASIAVQRIGGTLFLRSYKSRLRCNLSDIGYQFERACTGGDGQVFDSHYAATDVRVGRFRCLIESEIDAVDGDSGQLIELKSAAKWEGKITKQVNLWCQCMLGGVGRAILGNRDKKTDRIKSIEDLPIETLLTQGMKHKLLERLVRSLEFLDSSVRDDGVYLYHIPRRGPDTLKQLEQKHSFINVEMINAVKDSYT